VSRIVSQNVLRLLSDLGMTRSELSERSGVSISFLSDLTAGKANPSLRTLEALAFALDSSVPLLVTDFDLLPVGYEWVMVALPEEKVSLVKGWGIPTSRKRKPPPDPRSRR